MTDPIIERLEADHEASIQRLVDYVSLPSVSAQPTRYAEGIEASANWIADRCRELGMRVTRHETAGAPIVVAETPVPEGNPNAPRFMVYGHYDVQPPEPFDLWKTEPFKPTREGNSLIGRGASDNKGQHLAHVEAVGAYLSEGVPLPCQVVFVIEGEEEVGSEALGTFLEEQAEALRCDAVIISDNGIPSLDYPTLTYGLRGVAAMEVRLDGPNRDLHSGIFGGSIENPAMALCQLLGSLRDADGTILVEGFYDDVLPLTEFERSQMARWPETDEALQSALGAPALFGEPGFTSTERRGARPTLEINGLTSGYQGEGSKTIVPAWASAKITTRLVPNQDPEVILDRLEAAIRRRCPDSVRLTIERGHAGEPYLTSPEAPLSMAAIEALRNAFGKEPIAAREGGSIPIVNAFKKTLGADTLLLGLGLPDDNIHSPNEKFDLEAFRLGKRMSALLWPALAAKMGS